MPEPCTRPIKLLFYFNGFNSAIPDEIEPGSKLDEAQRFAAANGYRFLPVTIEYRRAAAQLEQILASIPEALDEVVFCGSSMGGWFARIAQVATARKGLNVVAVAFNPVARLDGPLRQFEGPQLNYVTGEHYHWHAEDTERLLALEASVDFGADLPFWVFCDRGDELIDWRDSRARYATIARFHAFPGGEHRFLHAREALEMFAQEKLKG
jgi:predicted esterase YcpF (UPF0227 family)